MKKASFSFPTVFILIVFVILACKKDEATITSNDPNQTTNNNGTSDELPSVFDKFSDEVTIYLDGDFVVFESNNLPDHNSPYYDQSDSRYEAYSGTNSNFVLNPNRIAEQSMTYRIPLNPTEASNKEATPLGAIGISTNGIAIFNQYAGPNQPLTNEINSFDQYLGHPQQSGVYHYHIEPLYLTENYGKEALVGFLLDGFPVYGPEEDGKKVTNDDLESQTKILISTEMVFLERLEQCPIKNLKLYF
jgi:hypothetical protein